MKDTIMKHTAYNSENIFAKIIRKEIPCKLIQENETALAFFDIAPKAKVHALVIPKGPYINAHDFHLKASVNEIAEFYAFLSQTIQHLQLQDSGYRLISNAGDNGRQEVPHYHVHILGGELLKSSLNG